MIFAFEPMDWVRITFAGVNYRGRVAKCHMARGGHQSFTVEFVCDTGDFKSGEFNDDEIALDSEKKNQ